MFTVMEVLEYRMELLMIILDVTLWTVELTLMKILEWRMKLLVKILVNKSIKVFTLNHINC